MKRLSYKGTYKKGTTFYSKFNDLIIDLNLRNPQTKILQQLLTEYQSRLTREIQKTMYIHGHSHNSQNPLISTHGKTKRHRARN